jgi:hypothetical protein
VAPDAAHISPWKCAGVTPEIVGTVVERCCGARSAAASLIAVEVRLLVPKA